MGKSKGNWQQFNVSCLVLFAALGKGGGDLHRVGTGIRCLCFFCVIYILMLSYMGDYTLKRKDLALLRCSGISHHQSDMVGSRDVWVSPQQQDPERNMSNEAPSVSRRREGRGHLTWQLDRSANSHAPAVPGTAGSLAVWHMYELAPQRFPMHTPR